MAARRNREIPADFRIAFRIGINLGDIILEGDDIYGGGVNIAARLEALADTGGIAVSGKVHDEIAGKLDLEFQDLGARQVKNIERPVRVYRVGSAAVPPEAAAAPRRRRRRTSRRSWSWRSRT